MKNVLRDIDWDEVPDLKKVFLAALILAIIVYADCSILLCRQISGLRQVCAKVNALSRDISVSNKEMLSPAPAYPAGSGKDRAGAQIIRFGDLPRLLRDVSAVSLRNNLKIMQILPQGEARQSKDAPASVKLPAVNISMELSGRFYDTVRFIRDLENYRYFLQVEDLKIRRSRKDYTLQDISLMLKVYVNK